MYQFFVGCDMQRALLGKNNHYVKVVKQEYNYMYYVLYTYYTCIILSVLAS